MTTEHVHCGHNGEQPVQLRQVRDAGPVADLDQELFPDNPEETLYFPPALGAAGGAVGDLDPSQAAARLRAASTKAEPLSCLVPSLAVFGGVHVAFLCEWFDPQQEAACRRVAF